MTRDEELERLEHLLGRLLTAGVLLSAILMSAGLAAWLRSQEAASTRILLGAGLVVLMSTPILRVVFSMVGYARMRDWLFVVTTLTVLAELALTCVYALRLR